MQLGRSARGRQGVNNETVLFICLWALIAFCAVVAGSENSNFVLGWL